MESADPAAHPVVNTGVERSIRKGFFLPSASFLSSFCLCPVFLPPLSCLPPASALSSSRLCPVFLPPLPCLPSAISPFSQLVTQTQRRPTLAWLRVSGGSLAVKSRSYAQCQAFQTEGT